MKNKNIFLILISIILIIIIIPIITEKNDYSEISANAYISSMGIDYDENYIVYLYILNNFNNTRSEYGSSNPDVLGYICKGQGKTIQEALSSINRNSNIKLQYSHIRSLIIQNNFFSEKHIKNLYKLIKLSKDFYPTFNVFITYDTLDTIYQVNNFSETSAYYTILVNTDTINKSQNTTFLDFINDILVSTYTPAYPVLQTSNDVFFENDKAITSIDITGYSYLKNDFTIQTFTFDEIQSLKHLNRLTNDLITFDDFTYLVYEYEIKKKIKNNKLKLTLYIKGTFTYKENLNIDYTNILKNNITKDLQNLKIKMDLENIDVFNIDHLTNKKDSYLNMEVKTLVFIG